MSRKHTYSEEQKKEIQIVKKQLEGTKIYKRIQVLDYSAKGVNESDIARLTDYSVSRVSDFVSEYFANGIGYFMEEHRKGGNRRNLTPKQEEEIIDEFRKEAEQGKVVTIDKIKEKYEKVRGKETANSTFYYFLNRMSWRRVMPRGEHPKKAAEAEIEASKKLTVASGNLTSII
jgi:transposase